MGPSQLGPLTDSQLDQLLQETQLDAAAGLGDEPMSQQQPQQQPQQQQQQQQLDVDAAGAHSTPPEGGLDEDELEQLLQDTAPAERDSQAVDALQHPHPGGEQQQQQQQQQQPQEEEGNPAGTDSTQGGVGPLSETQLQELLEPTCVDQGPESAAGGGATPATNSQQQQTQRAADQHMLALLDDDFDDDE
jgi:hypothetical protein